MKLQRLLPLLLATVLCFTAAGGMAAEETAVWTEIIPNGGFESVTDGKPDGVGIGGGAWGENFFLEEARPHEGKYAVCMRGSNNNVFLSWGSTALEAGTDTALSFYVKRIAAGASAIRVTTEYYSEKTVSAAAYMTGANEAVYITDLRDGRYVPQTVSLHVPEGARRAHVMIRLYGEGEIYIDDVSWQGYCTVSEEEDGQAAAAETEEEKLLPPREGFGEMVQNGSFENAEEDGTVLSWRPFGNENRWQGNTVISRTSEAHSGSYALKISGSGNPWACQGSLAADAGDRYQISCCIKSDGMPGKGFAFKIEAYNHIDCAPEHAVAGDASFDTRYYPTQTDGWYTYADTFTVKEGTSAVIIYARAYGGGTVLVDDVSLYKVDPEVAGALMCEEVFTYSDREGLVGAWMDLYIDSYPALLEAEAEFTITRGDKTVFAQTVKPDENGRVYAEYDRLLLTEKKVPYKVAVSVRDKDGKEVASDCMNVYKYDRPTRLRADGVYLMNGKPFAPVIAWAAGHTRLDEIKAAGVNVVMVSYWWANVEEDPTRLDTMLALLEQYDLYGIFALYINMVPAGHPERIRNTRLAVQRLKNHPRVFAYALQDEPTQTVNMKEVESLMASSYKAVRDIDPDIPVFCVDNSNHLDVDYRYSDLNCVDPYWQGNGKVVSFPQEVVERMNAINLFDKPTYSLVSAFNWRGAFPTADDTRHNVYQSLFAGAKGVGYYCFEGADTDADGNAINLMDTDRWPTLKKAQLEEYPLLFEHFVYRETPRFNEAKEKDVWYRSFVKDGKIYMAALSQSDTESAIVRIPLVSDTGIAVQKYIARVAYGGNTASIVRDDGILEYTLSPRQCVLFEITPQEEVDFSGLYMPKFDDLYAYPWAKQEIEALARKNIVFGRAGKEEHGFIPALPVTRAEFAMYLVRALGLVSNIQTSFADVNSQSYYAAELAAGKLGGILQGVGNNLFAPNGYITRQDMAVMVRRGLGMRGSGDLSAFADGDLTAGYAREALSALTEQGLIVGDENGLLNPRGNTTRAEAAVFLYRLLESIEHETA